MGKNFLNLEGSEESFLLSKKDIVWVSVKILSEEENSFTVESRYFLRNDSPSSHTFQPGIYASSTEQRESFTLTEKISSEKMAELKRKFGEDLGNQEICAKMILERLEEKEEELPEKEKICGNCKWFLKEEEDATYCRLNPPLFYWMNEGGTVLNPTYFCYPMVSQFEHGYSHFAKKD